MPAEREFLRHFGVDFITVILPDKMRFADRLLGPTNSFIFHNGGDDKVAPRNQTQMIKPFPKEKTSERRSAGGQMIKCLFPGFQALG